MASSLEDISAQQEAQQNFHPHDESIPEESKPNQTPIPVAQLSVVMMIQFLEAFTADVIYPFVNQFVRRTGVTHGDEKATGYYAGIIVSFFSPSTFVLSLNATNRKALSS